MLIQSGSPKTLLAVGTLTSPKGNSPLFVWASIFWVETSKRTFIDFCKIHCLGPQIHDFTNLEKNWTAIISSIRVKIAFLRFCHDPRIAIIDFYILKDFSLLVSLIFSINKVVAFLARHSFVNKNLLNLSHWDCFKVFFPLCLC